MTPTPQPGPGQAHRNNRPALGIITIGLLLVLLGAGWILRSMGVFALPWDTQIAIAVIVIGVALIAGSRGGHVGGLIPLGIILALVLVFGSSWGLRLEGGIGGHDVVRPTGVEELDNGYHIAMGTLTIDLRDLTLPEGTTEVVAGVGMGTLTVIVPREAAVDIHANIGAGSADLLGHDESGLGPRRYTTPDYSTSSRRLALELSMGMGTVEVRR